MQNFEFRGSRFEMTSAKFKKSNLHSDRGAAVDSQIGSGDIIGLIA